MYIQQQHLLADFEISLVQAGRGKRFANYIIDSVTYSIFIFYVGMAFENIFPASVFILDEIGENFFFNWLFSQALYCFYMFGTEAIFNGKTLGKWITGTRAVNQDGTKISVKTACLRSLCRMVPLYEFSALGSPSYPWHDRWTKTYVIDEKTSMKTECSS